MTFPAKGSGSLCLRKRFWDRHGANITTRQKVVYLDVETTLRHKLPPNKLQRLSRGDPKNLGANTRIRILSRERSSRDLPGKRIGLTKRKNIIRRSKEEGQAFPLHQNFLLEISVVRPVSQISHKATSLFAHFMKTPISHCFGICDKFISTVRCNSRCQRKMHIKIADENPWKNLKTLQENSGLSHLSRFGFSKLFGFSRIPHSNKYFVFFFPQTKLR